jgi:hypothetical protein
MPAAACSEFSGKLDFDRTSDAYVSAQDANGSETYAFSTPIISM